MLGDLRIKVCLEVVDVECEAAEVQVGDGGWTWGLGFNDGASVHLPRREMSKGENIEGTN